MAGRKQHIRPELPLRVAICAGHVYAVAALRCSAKTRKQGWSNDIHIGAVDRAESASRRYSKGVRQPTKIFAQNRAAIEGRGKAEQTDYGKAQLQAAHRPSLAEQHEVRPLKYEPNPSIGKD